MIASWRSFKPELKSIEFGTIWKYEKFTVCFGNKNFTEQEFIHSYPNVELMKIKQIHSSLVVLASNQLREADAHYTASSNVALQIKTADCIPLFILDPVTKIIMAVHAGWRGISGKIAEKALREMISMGAKPINLIGVIGPHIQRQSFEIDQPVWVELMDSIPIDFHHHANQFYEKEFSTLEQKEKYKLDLEGILRAQLKSMGVAEERISSLSKDTVADIAWHSHRRDKDTAGRNISFVLREN